MYVVNPTFQQSTAVLLYNAINTYFAEVDPTFRPQSLTLSSTAGR
jgi:hypothetical protein